MPLKFSNLPEADMPKAPARLKKCLDAGSLLNLFPMLKDWTREELEALLAEIDDYQSAVDKFIDAEWKRVALVPAIFFNAAKSTDIDQVRDSAKAAIAGALIEISSIAGYYFERRGGKLVAPTDTAQT